MGRSLVTLFSAVSALTRHSEKWTRLHSLQWPCCRIYQRQRIGSKLLSVGLVAGRAEGHAIAMVLGHPKFYRRFGFSSNLALSVKSPFGGGEAWMALELIPGALEDIEGRIEYSSPFSMFE